ncbi:MULTISPECIES: DUF4876 domain-containing protein [Myroides]|uniref:DUF4876 domain-containing protein n=1 Tax=Myroides albus TaxID=2562892 RepID=A0A6I3LHG3_9FLAO|nr:MULTISPECIES: DUF4876 domain-containing protein [Myroides]MTG97016.1 DUF4876 domain-containing protein [Myroides albus]MVX35812.1 DUF4876 domain-containing protein [Myroides sp. LoEW2-1]UVD78559.1 DUF4876 domain-containing protein [Myroides albus]
MKFRQIYLAVLLTVMSLTVSSCLSDDNATELTQNAVVSMTFKVDDVKEIKELEVEFTEVNTGMKTIEKAENTPYFSVALPVGSYRMSSEGIGILEDGEEVILGSKNEMLDITSQVTNVNIKLTVKQFTDDFIFEELFYTGFQTNEGKSYQTGRYFKIVNNTDRVLYADGLLIAQSDFMTTRDNKETPFILDEAFVCQSVMMLPGNGTDYPVEPGDFIVIADNAQNHNLPNVAGPDLTKADFEFPTLDGPKVQPDNPSVPNVDVIYTKMNFGMFVMHDRGYTGYIIARFPDGESVDSWLSEHKYDYSYLTGSGKEQSFSRYKIPNNWILDGVNNSIPDKLERLVTSAGIDSGFTYCATSDGDKGRYGKSVRRKGLGQNEFGREVYKDTNNSSVDFVPESRASLLDGIIHN